MYLNLVQIAESFGVAEKTVEDWIRDEKLPHIPDRGRLLFDRAQVANWAAARGLAAQAGFLAPGPAALSAGWQLEPLLRAGGIWREISTTDLPGTYGRVLEKLPGMTPALLKIVSQRIQSPGGITLAPVGGGYALPHPSARIALGRDSGAVALILLPEPLQPSEPAPDGVPLRRLLFFVAPSPRAHLDLLGKLSRLLTRSNLRGLLDAEATDAEILQAVADFDRAVAEAPKPGEDS